MPRKVIVPSLIYLFMVSAPYIFAALAGGQNYVFGGFLLNPQDGNSYLAKMYLGWRGEWRFTLPYTAEPGQGAYLFLFYIFLGHLARWTRLPLVWVFHIARLLGAVALWGALYRLFFRSRVAGSGSDWAFTLALLGSGFGWLASLMGAFTSDLWVAEAYPFLSAYASPHFALGLALLLFIFGYVVPGDQSVSIWPVAFLSLIMALIAPFGVVLAVVVLGGLIAFETIARRLDSLRSTRKSPPDADGWRRIRRLISLLFWVLVGGGAVLVYDLWVANQDPVLAGWNAQNLTPSPPVWDLVLSFSPALLLALPGGPRAWKDKAAARRLYLVWAVLGILLLYLPFGLQRRFMMGLFVPVAVLAGLGIEGFLVVNPSRARLLAAVVLLLSLPTNLLILLAARHGVATHDPQIYLSRDEALALDWLGANTPEDALVLASPDLGIYIPAHTGRRVIYGHPFETVDAAINEAAVSSFYSGDPGLDRRGFLLERGVNYIIYGPRERKLGILGEIEGTRLVYTHGEVAIYQVSADVNWITEPAKAQTFAVEGIE